jgi:N-methylhydantoinase A
VRDYVLVAFGGSGPLQAGRLVDILGLKAALIPPDPGNVSAFGLLTVDVKNDYVVTDVQRDESLDLPRVNAIYARLEGQARAALAAEGFAAAEMRLSRSADLRYFGQAWEVRVEVPSGPIERALVDVAVQRFHAAHQQTYGYSYAESPDQRVEWVNFRVVGIGPLRHPVVRPRARYDSGGALTGRRRVCFEGGFVETPIYTRPRLQPGDCVHGPAIIEEFGSTTVVFHAQEARVDDYGNLLLTRAE